MWLMFKSCSFVKYWNFIMQVTIEYIVLMMAIIEIVPKRPDILWNLVPFIHFLP